MAKKVPIAIIEIPPSTGVSIGSLSVVGGGGTPGPNTFSFPCVLLLLLKVFVWNVLLLNV